MYRRLRRQEVGKGVVRSAPETGPLANEHPLHCLWQAGLRPFAIRFPLQPLKRPTPFCASTVHSLVRQSQRQHAGAVRVRRRRRARQEDERRHHDLHLLRPLRRGGDQRRNHRHKPLHIRRPAHRRQARQRPLPPARRPYRQHLADDRRFSRRGQPRVLRLRRRARRVGNSADGQDVHGTEGSDATGLLYYNARYYDPTLGTFISPDSLVPDPGRVIDYNRFLYARGNPLKYTDPSGSASDEAIREWEAKNSWYNARGWAWGGSHWNVRIGKRVFRSQQAAIDVLGEAGIAVDRSEWDLDNLKLLIEGIDRFALEIGQLFGLTGDVAIRQGLERLRELTDGATSWHRLRYGYGLCWFGAACVIGSSVSFYDDLFKSNENHIRATAVHEMAHVIHNMSCHTVMGMDRSCTVSGGLIQGVGYGLPGWGTDTITNYAQTNRWEYWAEAVADWVYKDLYRPSEPPLYGGLYRTTGAQRDYIMGVFRGP